MQTHQACKGLTRLCSGCCYPLPSQCRLAFTFVSVLEEPACIPIAVQCYLQTAQVTEKFMIPGVCIDGSGDGRATGDRDCHRFSGRGCISFSRRHRALRKAADEVKVEREKTIARPLLGRPKAAMKPHDSRHTISSHRHAMPRGTPRTCQGVQPSRSESRMTPVSAPWMGCWGAG